MAATPEVLFTPEDSLSFLTADCNRLHYLLPEITDEYFDRHNPEDEAGRKLIIHEFKRCAALADIASHLIADVQENVERLEQLISEEAGV